VPIKSIGSGEDSFKQIKYRNHPLFPRLLSLTPPICPPSTDPIYPGR